ncbi:hypothetical protein GQR58_023023 [Nymphon striatum]|nr:hypothetical protein GQR58_023023 [Nymphon striatum]
MMILHSLPANTFSIRATCYDSFDLFHSHLCVTKTYHSCPTDTCICSYCSAPASRHHHRSCSILHPLSPPQKNHTSLTEIPYILGGGGGISNIAPPPPPPPSSNWPCVNKQLLSSIEKGIPPAGIEPTPPPLMAKAIIG